MKAMVTAACWRAADQLREDIMPDPAAAVPARPNVFAGLLESCVARHRFRVMQPYPRHLVKTITLADGTSVTLRPIRASDADIEQQFVRGLSEESRYFRFMDMLRELSPQMLKQMTHIDYDDRMAVIAVARSHGRQIQIAVGRYVVMPNGEDCEFAIVVGDAWHQKGIATALMQILIEAACRRGLKTMFGEVLASNTRMLHFVRTLGFHAATDPQDPRQMRVTKNLQDTAARVGN
jgi:acetyltransferase